MNISRRELIAGMLGGLMLSGAEEPEIIVHTYMKGFGDIDVSRFSGKEITGFVLNHAQDCLLVYTADGWMHELRKDNKGIWR